MILTEVGSSRIAVIKLVRAQTGLGLRESKELVESVPTEITDYLSKESAEGFLSSLEDAGATGRIDCMADEQNETDARPNPLDERQPLPPINGKRKVTDNVIGDKIRRSPLLNMETVDAQQPKVTILSSTIRVRTVGDTVQLHVVAEDNEQVASIVIYAENHPVKTCSAAECWHTEKVYQAGPREYYAEARDSAGNRGLSDTLRFMVHPSSKPGPSLNTRITPYQPAGTDRVKFTATASHTAGVQDISLFIDGELVKTCHGSSCEFIGGPYGAGEVAWRFAARSLDGGETYGSTNHLQIAALPVQGHCSISGKATGAGNSAARVFSINIYGPDNEQLFRQSTGFTASGNYLFTNLPEGQYRLVVDTRADTFVHASPRIHNVYCRGVGVHDVNFEFR